MRSKVLLQDIRLEREIKKERERERERNKEKERKIKEKREREKRNVSSRISFQSKCLFLHSKKVGKEKATYVCSPPPLPFNVEKEEIHLDELIMSVTSFEGEGNFFVNNDGKEKNNKKLRVSEKESNRVTERERPKKCSVFYDRKMFSII